MARNLVEELYELPDLRLKLVELALVPGAEEVLLAVCQSHQPSRCSSCLLGPGLSPHEMSLGIFILSLPSILLASHKQTIHHSLFIGIGFDLGVGGHPGRRGGRHGGGGRGEPGDENGSSGRGVRPGLGHHRGKVAITGNNTFAVPRAVSRPLGWGAGQASTGDEVPKSNDEFRKMLLAKK